MYTKCNICIYIYTHTPPKRCPDSPETDECNDDDNDDICVYMYTYVYIQNVYMYMYETVHVRL